MENIPGQPSEQETTLKKLSFKSIIGFILTCCLAAVFFFSAYSKIYSDHAFDGFQWSFFDLGIKSQLATGIISRLMIGFEVALGLFLLLHLYLKSFTYKAILVTLSIFIIYLIVLVIRQGNGGNCGCFGDRLAMTPLQAIVKNIIMMAATVLLMNIYVGRNYRHQDIISIVVGIFALTVPFLYNPLNISSAPVKFTKPISLDALYNYDPAPAMDLRQGKHIVAFMTLNCPHCKKAAYLLQIIHREHPEIPVYMVLAGDPHSSKAFFDETHASSVPHLLYNHWPEFTAMVGEEGYPAIYWLNNGTIEYRSQRTYYQLDPKYMIEWLNK